MSIGKRFIRLVRSNLNTLLDRTADLESYSESSRIEDLSDQELEAEIERRRQRREAARRAAARASTSSYDQQAWQEVEEATRGGSGRFRTAGWRPQRGTGRYEPPGRRRTATGPAGYDPRLARLYAQLECPYGADLNAVRKQYRTMMRKYHPDMHSGNAEKQRLATELSQKLTEVYNDLRRILSSS